MIDVPPDIALANALVNEAVEVRPYHAWDFTPLPETGNCVSVAWTKYRLLQKRYGARVMMASCVLVNGQHHAFAVVDSRYFLDDDQPGIKTRAQMDCAGTIWKIKRTK